MTSGAEVLPVPAGDAAASWARSRRVALGGWSIRYRDAGRGPTIVLVHGLGLSADAWYGVGPELAARGYRVLAPDLPGFGRTRGPRGGLSVPAQADFLVGWTRAMGLGSATFVGYSLSCQVVMEIAAAAPERVERLALIAPTGDRRGSRMLRQAWTFALDIPRETVSAALRVAGQYLQAGPRRIWRTWRLGAQSDPVPLIERIAAPATVIVGRRDPVVDPGFAERLASGMGGRVEWVESAAHGAVFTHPAEIVDRLASFVPRGSEERGSAAG